MGPGSIRGSIITLAASACGSGVMVLPNLAAKNGLYLLLLTILVVAGCAYWGHYMLTQRARHYNIKTFAQLSELAGGKILRYVLVISILFFLFAGSLACQIISKY
jgi:amino acid permease